MTTTLFGTLSLRRRNTVHLSRISCYRRGLSSLTKTDNTTKKLLYEWNIKISHLIRSGKLAEARAFFDSIEHRNTVTWNSMLTGYVMRREIAKARQLFDEMPRRDIVSWNLIISGYFSCRRSRFIEEGRKLFDQMPRRDSVSWNTVISGYAKNGMMDQALELFNELPQLNVVSCNAIITGFLWNGNVGSAVAMFNTMPERDAASLSALISGLVRNGELSMAAQILLEFGNRDDDGKGNLVQAYNTLLAGYGQRGMVEEARQLFDGIPSDQGDGSEDHRRFRRNVVSWNSMMMCYVKVGDIVSARELFDRMMERDACSWNTMISGYVQISDMKEASKLFSKMPSPDEFSWSSIVSGFSQIGDLKLAREFFERMPCKNVISWNSVITGYEKNEDYKGAIELFYRMQLEGEKPDRHTLSSVLSVCTGLVDLYLGKQIHQLVTKIVIADLPINNSLITMYSRCGAIGDARELIEWMPCKNLISWNSVIAGYEKNKDYKGAIELFSRMQLEGERPDRHTLSSVLSVCTGLVDLYLGKQIHQLVKKIVISDLPINNSLITMYSRCGAIGDAWTVFNEMKLYKYVITWNAMIGGLAFHGLAAAALELFELMKRHKIQPTHITFISVLNACAHAGLVEEGKRQFNSMITDYGIKPRVEHFASLVDLLVRQGQLQEAMDLINSMPVKPDKAVWGATRCL